GNHVTVASTDAASVNLSLGGGDDTLTLSGSSNLNDVADGGGGINTLDYTGYGSAVTVDLSTGTATGTFSVSNFQILEGSSNNDTLAGNSSGSTTFLASTGLDAVTGQGGTNTLIGANATSLFAITSTDAGQL